MSDVISNLTDPESLRFPSPVGGVALPFDFAPSIFFSALYGLLLPLVIFRIVSPQSRSLILISLTIFVLERFILFIFRAVQSNNASLRVSGGALQWMQGDFAVLYSSIFMALMWLFLCVSVNATKLSTQTDATVKARSKFRLVSTQARILVTLSIQGVGIPMGILYESAAKGHPHVVSIVSTLRYIIAVLMLSFSVIFVVAVIYERGRLPSIDKRACTLLCYLSIPLFIISIYRLAVMGCTTTSLTSMAPCSLNSPLEKAEFYVFHVLPEWLGVALLIGMNTREIFQTGPYGDRKRDDAKSVRALAESVSNVELIDRIDGRSV